MTKFALFTAVAMNAVADGYAKNTAHNNAMQVASTEDNKWERRKAEGLKMIELALVTDHSRSYVSVSSKARTATRLQTELVEYCNRRSEILTKMTEDQIAGFMRTGL